MDKKIFEGFTLIELLVVIAIIGILVGVGFIFMGNYQDKQNDEKRKNDIISIADALEQFRADHGHYPFINWYSSEHAYEALGIGSSADCVESNMSATYTPANVGTPDFEPGTGISFHSVDGVCDDLSLQLLGQAYLAKMPANAGDDPGWVIPGNDPEEKLKVYLTVIPKDPNYLELTGNNGNWFRYFYNSYYQCSSEGINVGDAYWLNSIVKTESAGDFGQQTTEERFYEIGSVNFERSPSSGCL